MIMDIEEIIMEQLESISEQKKAYNSGQPNVTSFLHKANILLTIDSYIKELDNLNWFDHKYIESLQNSWKQLLQNVNIVPPTPIK